MLTELAVRNLGVIEELVLVLQPGMTALTGETGAGKTLLVDAIELLVGGRADTGVVRQGAAECSIEGRFVVDDTEVVLSRVIPRDGRSRAYRNGRLATVAQLAEEGSRLVDLHGQHSHQSLLGVAEQRAALDAFGGIDLAPLRAARARVAEVEAELAALGGDERARAREIDLLRYQVEELDRAALDDPEENSGLEVEEDRLADAVAHREAAERAAEALSGDGGALDTIGAARSGLAGRAPFADLVARLHALEAEAADVGADLRRASDAIAEDPERLADVRARRQLLRELTRKYGETLHEVLAYRDEARTRLAMLLTHDERVAALDSERGAALAQVEAEAQRVREARRAAAPRLAKAVQAHLTELALPRARLAIDLDGDTVTYRLAANAGEDLAPLSRVASGGELARTMLALRLVVTEAPPTLVFDEVDAGVGGQAALAVGRSLASLGATHQVLVVTHLAQVAAYADAQIAVDKQESKGRTVVTAAPVVADARAVELSRMLSGMPSSATARDHAEELLATAARERGR
ncbi:MAG TPA: DNA repair protein RecN [Acidimicrobiales bacterium]|nr:DNA repair protein RecN [Acidimicrobiales bacterium]